MVQKKEHLMENYWAALKVHGRADEKELPTAAYLVFQMAPKMEPR